MAEGSGGRSVPQEVDFEGLLREKQREIDKLLEDIKDFRGGIALGQEVVKALEAQGKDEEMQGSLDVIGLESAALKMMLEDLVKAMKGKRAIQAEMEAFQGRTITRDFSIPAGYSPT